jgi:16S rRNA (cytosine967-C5)-methyltransferase
MTGTEPTRHGAIRDRMNEKPGRRSVMRAEQQSATSAAQDGAVPGSGDGTLRFTAALLEACERALNIVLRLEGPADTTLRDFFRSESKLGRRDRGTIAETVFDVLRNRRRYGHFAQALRGSLPRRLMWLSFASRFGEAAIGALAQASDDERNTLRRTLAIDPDSLSQAVRLSLPDWLHAALLEQAAGGRAEGAATEGAATEGAATEGAATEGAATEGAATEGAATEGADERAIAEVERLGRALLEPAPLDLRVNLLKVDRAAVLAALEAAGIDAVPLAAPATAIRVSGRPALEKLPAFEQGWFEVQDAGSQLLVEFAAPKRGQTVIDFCAGAGGKTLAIAAAMRSTGQVYACDVSMTRLQRLKPRLARSGATSVQPFGIDTERDPKLRRLKGRADLVLVDVPCSGTGTLRRNPEIKWRLQPEALDELAAKQRAILFAASGLVKRGGALVYGTCSLLARENEQIVAEFSKAHSTFGTPVLMRIGPHMEGCDGFFAARWTRSE